ncbi:hypothetical protein QFZ91_005278 [Paraburkholderia sp. JPY419]
MLQRAKVFRVARELFFNVLGDVSDYPRDV